MIADAIRQAQKMHRTMIEQTYDGICSIYQIVHEKDPDTKVTKQQERQMSSGIPCHLSFSGFPSADTGETVTDVSQTIKLFLNPEQEIPAGTDRKLRPEWESGGLFVASGNRFGAVERICVMPKWGKCDFRELENLQKRMEKLEKEQDAFCRKCAQELAARLLYLVGKRTPVGTIPEDAVEDEKIAQQWEGYTGGTLRRGWTASRPKKGSDGWEIEIINNVIYASYVEYGHRQTPGRYVPAIGKKLKSGWVEGKFMLTLSVKDVERMAPKLIEKKLEALIKETVDAK